MNGEGIYSTRPWSSTKDGDTFFTKSKDGKYVYLHSTVWPGKALSVKNIAPIAGTKVTMLGSKNSLKWTQTGKDIQISIPDNLQTETNRPSKYVWVFKVQVKK